MQKKDLLVGANIVYTERRNTWHYIELLTPDNKILDNIIMVALRCLEKDIELKYCQDLKDIKNVVFASRLPNNCILIFLLFFFSGFKSI